ncbi:MAG: choice-of-anchor D domain-containing protein [Deltaproteobacteria bacterium]|nr:choice-of-anchor D domain-containing protein [Deltaproteobacteria bacterium]
MRPTRALHLVTYSFVFLGIVLASGCVNEISTGDCKEYQTCDAGQEAECVLDNECNGGICVRGFCETSLGTEPEPDAGQDPDGIVPDGGGIAAILPSREIDFGSPLLNVSVDQVLQLQNLGSGPLVFDNIARDVGTSEEFTWSIDVVLPFTLQAQETLDVTLHYTLADGEEDNGRLFFATDASSCSPACENPARIAIDVFSEFKGARNLDVTPETHDFGYVPVNETSSALSVLIKNVGTIDKILTVNSLEATGDVDAFEYTLPSLPLYISPGDSVEIPVVYSPSILAGNDELVITAQANSDNPANVTHSSTLTATSQPPNALVFTTPPPTTHL